MVSEIVQKEAIEKMKNFGKGFPKKRCSLWRPCRRRWLTTWSNNIKSEVQSDAEEKRSTPSEIIEAVDSGGASANVDMWTDEYVQRNFLGITLHYEKEFKLCDMILGLKSMDFQKWNAD